MRKTARVERLADAGNAPVHHVARGDEIHSCAGLCHGHLPQQGDRRVVVHIAVPEHAAMPVVCVLTQADVTDHEQLGHGALDRADGLLDDPLLVVRLGARRVLGRRNAEQYDAAEAERRRAHGVLHQLVGRQLVHAGHGRDGPAHGLAVRHEQGPHELRGDEVGLLHQAAQRRCPAQTPQPHRGEVAHRASKLAAPSASSKRATASPAASDRAGSSGAEAVS